MKKPHFFVEDDVIANNDILQSHRGGFKMKTLKELKTLKDLGYITGTNDVRFINEIELKAEAIKWVKHYLIQHNDKKEDWDVRCCAHGAIEALKDFFNITEEDLK